MVSKVLTRRANGLGRGKPGILDAAAVWWREGLMLVTLLVALAGTAFGQATNQILAIDPDTAPAGASALLVTFTLDTDFPPPPPPGDGPQSVLIGSLGGTSITHPASQTVTALLSIPAQEPAGAKDVRISFAIPGGTLVFGSAGGFTVTSGQEDYTIERTLADQAQRNTIAFDGLAFLTGNLGGQSFLPPGKVADYSGFQCLRDNDPTGLGHNTDFVTIIAFNVLHVLSAEQVGLLVARARTQVDLINEYAYRRFPLMQAFRRLLEGDVPPGSAGLDSCAVKAFSAELYRLDGLISYDRARLFGSILRALTPAQTAALDSLKAFNGVGNWDATLTDPLRDLRLDHDVNVAVMTYASEMYSWYAGDVEADVYFCPERQGTYFGSFYLKDWPAMGNPNTTIDEQLTARAGEEFLGVLTAGQAAQVTGLLDAQRSDLYGIVERRRDIATLLRQLLTDSSIDSAAVMDLSGRYGELDGAIVWRYATCFAAVRATLSSAQQAALSTLADSLGYVPATGAFLYSQPIPMPSIANTDYLFLTASTDVGGGTPPAGDGPALRAAPNPFNPRTSLSFHVPRAGRTELAIYDARGTCVATLLDGDVPAGDRSIGWDGTRDRGARLPSGVYFARLKTSAGQRTVKVSLAR